MCYLVESHSGWFVVDAATKRKAKSEGIAEWGRGSVKSVKRATQDDIASFVSQKGAGALQPTIP
jgi:hypothetical protein